MQLASQSNGLLNALKGKLSGPASLVIICHYYSFGGSKSAQGFPVSQASQGPSLFSWPHLSLMWMMLSLGIRQSGHRAERSRESCLDASLKSSKLEKCTDWHLSFFLLGTGTEGRSCLDPQITRLVAEAGIASALHIGGKGQLPPHPVCEGLHFAAHWFIWACFPMGASWEWGQ